MIRLLRILRYLAFLLFAPVARAGLRVIAIGLRLKRLKIGKVTFVGSANFLEIVKEAEKTIRKYDPEILAKMIGSFNIMNVENQEKQVLCYPGLGYGFISDPYVAWGSEGVVAVWINFLYLVHISRRNQWAMNDPKASIAISRQAREKASLWLKQYQFPEELCQAMAYEKT